MFLDLLCWGFAEKNGSGGELNTKKQWLNKWSVCVFTHWCFISQRKHIWFILEFGNSTSESDFWIINFLHMTNVSAVSAQQASTLWFQTVWHDVLTGKLSQHSVAILLGVSVHNGNDLKEMKVMFFAACRCLPLPCFSKCVKDVSHVHAWWEAGQWVGDTRQSLLWNQQPRMYGGQIVF